MVVDIAVADIAVAVQSLISLLLMPTLLLLLLIWLLLQVAYLAVTEWQDKRERDQLAVSALEERQKLKDAKPPGPPSPRKKPKGFGSK